MATRSQSSPKLDVAIAELAILLKTAVADIADIKTRLSVMDEQFARKSEVALQASQIEKLQESIGNLKTQLAVNNTKLATWGIIGGVIITLLAAAISTLQIHL